MNAQQHHALLHTEFKACESVVWVREPWRPYQIHLPWVHTVSGSNQKGLCGVCSLCLYSKSGLCNSTVLGWFCWIPNHYIVGVVHTAGIHLQFKVHVLSLISILRKTNLSKQAYLLTVRSAHKCPESQEQRYLTIFSYTGGSHSTWAYTWQTWLFTQLCSSYPSGNIYWYLPNSDFRRLSEVSSW